jgi:hypothetical protein
MLIHQSDFIIINLEKAQDKYHHSYFKQEWDLAEKWEVIWDWFCLVFNIQINWKIKRAEYRFEVQSQEDYYKLNPEKSNDPDIKEYVIIDYRWIYATLWILTDLWYNLKNGEFENHYKIISKIEEEIVYYYECNKNNNTIGEPKTI